MLINNAEKMATFAAFIQNDENNTEEQKKEIIEKFAAFLESQSQNRKQCNRGPHKHLEKRGFGWPRFGHHGHGKRFHGFRRYENQAKQCKSQGSDEEDTVINVENYKRAEDGNGNSSERNRWMYHRKLGGRHGPHHHHGPHRHHGHHGQHSHHGFKGHEYRHRRHLHRRENPFEIFMMSKSSATGNDSKCMRCDFLRSLFDECDKCSKKDQTVDMIQNSSPVPTEDNLVPLVENITIESSSENNAVTVE